MLSGAGYRFALRNIEVAMRAGHHFFGAAGGRTGITTAGPLTANDKPINQHQDKYQQGSF
jgi:hypothetical protein